MPKLFDLKKFNQLLKENGQILYAMSITGKKIVLSNGAILTNEKDVRLCKKRIMNGNDIWKKNFDKLYGLDLTQKFIVEKECRARISSVGGMNCQNKHKDKVKQNLNTGIPWNKGYYPYKKILTEESKQKISIANSGSNNGMYGKRMSLYQKEIRSQLMKDKILSGKFTPNSNNRNTHWESYYKNKKYRSSWEALYQYFDEDAEYETLRIPYSFNHKEYIYIVDFVNHKTKTLVEVKPKELLSNNKIQEKINSAKQWCYANGYRFLMVDKEYLISKTRPIDLCHFDIKTQQKIRNLYEIS